MSFRPDPILMPLPDLKPLLPLVLALSAGLAEPGLAADEAADLRVQFGPGRSMLAGRVDSEASANALAATLSEARPDLPVDRSALVVDPSAALPGLSDLRALLAELGLSTHEGRLVISRERLLVSGLTDSIVTQSAIRLRASPLLEGRAYHSRLCIVETDALPPIGPSLTAAGPIPTMIPEVPAVPEKPFETPGVRLEDLLPTLRMLSRVRELSGKPAPALTASSPLRAEPMSVADAPIGAAPAPAMPPQPTREALPSLYFSRNSFLLQANQEPAIADLTKLLLQPTRQGMPVLVEAVRPEGGSGAFNDYLCERRVAEVIRILTELGIAAPLVRGSTVSGTSGIDGGEVRISIEIPPPAPPSLPGTAETSVEKAPSAPL